MDNNRENEAKYVAAYHIKDDLAREKAEIIEKLYAGSIDGFFGINNNGMTPDEMIEATLRVEEITRILDAVRLGYYKAP